MRKVMNALRKWKINRMTGRGVVLLRIGKPGKALKLLTRTIELDPENQMAWTAKGLSLAMLERHKEALQSYNKAFILNPSNEERKQLDILIKRSKEQG